MDQSQTPNRGTFTAMRSMRSALFNQAQRLASFMFELTKLTIHCELSLNPRFSSCASEITKRKFNAYDTTATLPARH